MAVRMPRGLTEGGVGIGTDVIGLVLHPEDRVVALRGYVLGPNLIRVASCRGAQAVLKISDSLLQMSDISLPAYVPCPEAVGAHQTAAHVSLPSEMERRARLTPPLYRLDNPLGHRHIWSCGGGNDRTVAGQQSRQDRFCSLPTAVGVRLRGETGL